MIYFPCISTKVVLEGGALKTDGEGTLISTESSILNTNRNPQLTRGRIEFDLQRLLGVEKVIWLPGLWDMDVTDAHVDAWVRVIEHGRLLLNNPGSGKVVETECYETNRRILSQAVDAQDRRFELVDLPEADSGELAKENPDLCYSYVNYLLVNGAVVAPRFGGREANEKAEGMLRGVFPGRDVVQVYLRELAGCGGRVHCMTQEIPGVD
ncbi:hypothetical protein BJX70DRAFT_394725 [Aspergillus crustosus]